MKLVEPVKIAETRKNSGTVEISESRRTTGTSKMRGASSTSGTLRITEPVKKSVEPGKLVVAMISKGKL